MALKYFPDTILLSKAYGLEGFSNWNKIDGMLSNHLNRLAVICSDLKICLTHKNNLLMVLIHCKNIIRHKMSAYTKTHTV